MAALRDLDYRVIGKQRKHPSAQGGSFHAQASGARPMRAPRGGRWATGRALSVRPLALGVPGTGLEPVRPRGAARFKLAVSAFHHPGAAPWVVRARTSLPIGEQPRAYPGARPRTANRRTEVVLFYWQLRAHQHRVGATAHTGAHRTCPYAAPRPRQGIDAISTPPYGGPSPPQGGPGAAGIRPESRTETGARADTPPPLGCDHGRNAPISPHTTRQEPPP